MNPKMFLDMAKGLAGKGGNSIELPAPQGWYDRLLNGINRTGRPLLLVAVIAFFWWAIRDTAGFIEVMKAFNTVPEWITTGVLMVIGIFGTGRIINDVRKKNTVMQEIGESMDAPASEPDAAPTVVVNVDRKFSNLDDENEEVKEDAEEILTAEPENDAISAWKRKNAAS